MKKITSIIITLLLFILVGCNNQEDNLIVQDDNPPQINYANLKELDLPKDQIKLMINGQPINLSSSVYLDKNRYYICLNEIIGNLNGSLKKNDDTLILNVLDKSISLDITNNKFKNADIEEPLKEPLMVQDDFYYINFSDLANILDMYTRWDINNKTIYCKTFGNSMDNIKPYNSKIETLGFLRLEDITIPTESYDKDYLDKIRIMVDYLSKRNVPYHIAWIPRYISPTKKIDIDPKVINDFADAELVYTMDFCVSHKGLIGLHGYTHQSGNEDSGVGTEFGNTEPSPSRFKERIEKALDTAKYLDIPVSFFETPHYAITEEQNKIAETYFKILYYPHDHKGSKPDLTKPQLSPYNKSSYYISTPLDYIPGNDIKGALDRIKHCDTKKMGSIFYHPRLDFDYINLKLDNNIPSFDYSNESTLKNLIAILEEKGFKMSKVTDIN